MNGTAITQISLDTLAPGQTAYVCSMSVQGEIRRRLQELGITAGAPVTCVMRAPSGDPTAYRIRSAVIAIRREDARGVHVSLNAPDRDGSEVCADGG